VEVHIGHVLYRIGQFGKRLNSVTAGAENIVTSFFFFLGYLRHSGHYGRAEAADLTIPNR
jgi:hypothetical protein